MRPPRSAAARRSLAIWRGAPLSDRVHCHIRWWTAPFAALETEVPRDGAILEIGCGHALFSTYLALTSTSRQVRGVDIDADKIEQAGLALARLAPGEADIAVEHRPSGDVPTRIGGWDAIVLVDVLYLLSPSARRELLGRCVDALAPDGVLILKEVDTSPRLKAAVAQFQEFLATKVFRFTATDHDLHFPSVAELRGLLVDCGLAVRTDRLDRGYFHPHCVVIGTRPLRAA